MAKSKGIPFIYYTTEAGSNETVTGFKFSILNEFQFGGNYKGVMIAGVGGGLCNGSSGNGEKDREKKASTLEGLLISGFVGGSDGPVKGAIISGMLAYNRSTVKGVSAGGIVNLSKDKIDGVAFGGLCNRVEGKFNGKALSLGINSIKENLNGVAFGGIANYIEKSAKGMILSWGVNYVKEAFAGFAYGLVGNRAHHNEGNVFQMGFANHVTEYHNDGFVIQIGLYNHVGNREVPLINVVGLKSLFKRKEKQR